MKRILTLLSLLIMVACNHNNATQTTNNGNSQNTGNEEETTSLTIGSDVSWLSEMEDDGISFKDDSGNTDLFAILKNLGQNAIRLRVWVNPDDAKGWSGKDDVVKMAKRAAAAGMDVMIDFHYSDFFADPSRQTIPAAWTDASVSALSDNVAAHTNEVLSALKSAGVSPKWIQIGNETRNGMLWSTGQLWTDSGDIADGWSNFATLYKAGYSAAKAIFPNAKVMPHLNHAYEDNAWWFTKLQANGAKFDMIGLSHYPMADNDNKTWSELNTTAATQIKNLASKFGVDVMVVEIGIKSSNFTTGANCIKDFMNKVRDIDGFAGIFYWEPEVYGGWKPAIYSNIPSKYDSNYSNWSAYDQGAFTSEGKPSDALKALK